MKLIDDYLDAVKAVQTTGRALGEKFVEVLKPMFPDLTFYLGGEGAGAEMLFLWDSSGKYDGWNDYRASYNLDLAIIDAFPELRFHIDAAGIWLYPEEVDRVKQILTQWKESEK